MQRDKYKRGAFATYCEEICVNILQKNECVEEFKTYLKDKQLKYLMFVKGFYDFSMWRKQGDKLQGVVDMDALNIVHWVLFFN